MSDGGIGLDLGQHGGQVATGTAAIATILTTWGSRFFRARDERAREEAQAKRETGMLVQLAELKRDLAHALSILEAQTKLAERVAVLEHQVARAEGLDGRLALAEGKAHAAHERGDDFNRRLERLEARE